MIIEKERPQSSRETSLHPHTFENDFIDYYTLKSGYLFDMSWDTRLFLRQQFEKLMHWLLGANWRERILDGE